MGDIYEGNFADDQRSGQGKFIGADGYKYEGSWQEGQIKGEGEVIYPDGSRYVGTFTKWSGGWSW